MNDNIETRKARFNVIIQLGPRDFTWVVNEMREAHFIYNSCKRPEEIPLTYRICWCAKRINIFYMSIILPEVHKRNNKRWWKLSLVHLSPRVYTRQIVTHQLSAGMQLVHCENKPPFVLCCEFCSSRFKPSRLWSSQCWLLDKHAVEFSLPRRS